MSRPALGRTMTLAGSVVLLLGLLISACDDGESEVDPAARETLIEVMVSEGATEEQARCFVDKLGKDAERLVNEPDAQISDEDGEKLIEALIACGVE